MDKDRVMPQLTIEQLAARAAKKRNNRMRRELPLLAAMDAIPGDWLTTEDAQKARIERQRANFKDWWTAFEEAEKQRALLAERCKAECHELASEEQFEEMVRDARHTQHLSPVYALDYWSRQLARLDPRYCPHLKDGHRISKAMGHDRCPVCLVEGLLDER